MSGFVKGEVGEVPPLHQQAAETFKGLGRAAVLTLTFRHLNDHPFKQQPSSEAVPVEVPQTTLESGENFSSTLLPA